MNTADFTPITQASLSRAASLMKVLGHPSRLQIMLFLEEAEKTVTVIQKHAGLTQAMTSQHLKTLRDTGLLHRRRQGTSIYYSISPVLGKELLNALKHCQELWLSLSGT